MRVALVCLATSAAVTLAGCEASHESEPRGGPLGGPAKPPAAAADCTSQIRTHGVIYTGYAYTQTRAVRYSTADEADCHDLGPDAEGSVFSDTPKQVAVWTFRGYSPDEVLGVRFDNKSFAVFVAESVAPHDRNRILQQLGQRARPFADQRSLTRDR